MSVQYLKRRRTFQSLLPGIAGLSVGAQTLKHLIAISRQRRKLSDLDAHLLDDIGISQWEAERETGRPFWDVPRHWKV